MENCILYPLCWPFFFFSLIQPYVFNMQVGDWIEKIKLHKSFEFLV